MKNQLSAVRIGLCIVLCTSLLTGCWAVAAGACAEGAYVLTQPDRSASETLTDQRITASIKTSLLADPEVSGLDINVDTSKSVVTLRGVVRTTNEATRAVYLASRVSGVERVISNLVVTP